MATRPFPGWNAVLARNMPLLVRHVACHMINKPAGSHPLHIHGRKFWLRNPNTIGILQLAMTETMGIRGRIYAQADALLDVGAHAGAKAFAAKHANPALPVVLFEPNPLNVELLKATFAGVSGIEIVEAGVGEKAGVHKLYFDPDHLDTASLNPSHYFLQKNKRREVVEREVRIIALDEYFSGGAPFTHAFLKIDVESAEAPVLAGAVQTLKRCAYVEIEISQANDQSASDILAWLAREMRFDVLECGFIGADQQRAPRAMNVLLARRPEVEREPG